MVKRNKGEPDCGRLNLGDRWSLPNLPMTNFITPGWDHSLVQITGSLQVRNSKHRDRTRKASTIPLSATPGATSSPYIAPVRALKVFVSHASEDAKVAEAFADLLRNALNLPPAEIRCTSVLSYALPYASETDKELKAEVIKAPVFVGIITPSSVESSWVLFELGARWGGGPILDSIASGRRYVRFAPSSYTQPKRGAL